MATDILSIPQIPTVDLLPLQNDLHIGFGGDIAKRLQNARWTDETHATKVFPEAVDALMGAFVVAQATEDQVYVLAQGSDLTKQRLEKDRQRDVLYKEIRKTVDTFATLSIFPEKQAKALVMQPVMQKYNIQPDGGIEAQTVATAQWLQEQQSNYQCELAARELGIFESIQQLKTLNDEIQQLTADRNDERRRTNRRVAVKSEAIGRHTYATVSGWTWARLIQDGKALLAIDDETEPARIVSTDKKALKLGGLVLALDGAAVKPADEVDATREYELVAAE